MNFLKSFLQKFRGDERQQRNLTLLSALGDQDANAQHIASRVRARHEAARLTSIALRRMKEDREKGLAQIELYLDDWQFHNGPITTKEQLRDACVDCIDRVRQRKQAARRARQLAEDAAFDSLTGLEDFPF